MVKNIAVLSGDGIGPEITHEGIKVLNQIANQYGHTFNYELADFGAEAYFKTGSPFPEATKKICDQADTIIKGPVGLAVEKMLEIPLEQRPEKGAILPLRARYDTFANYRPVYLPPEYADFSPLKKEVIGNGINILMIRELVGGIYFGNKTEGVETNNTYASDDCHYDYAKIKRIAVTAFEEATKNPFNRLTNIHKSNVLATSRFWNQVVEEVQENYPDVEYQSVLVDNAAYQLVINPAQYNGVMLLNNMMGDILTDQAGGVLGSLGLMPSACIGTEKGYVEPAHGSAPDIAGQNIANPYSMIGSIAFLLEKCFNLEKEGQAVWNALKAVFGNGYRTKELAGNHTDSSHILSTTAFGDKVVEYLQKH
ncbi:MAG: 3-isopropylmalate dehydrogenase [Spirochaetes bacterium]|nr:3-isopropylmalate dehydrogenase [Spirochaetota bacterium]